MHVGARTTPAPFRIAADASDAKVLHEAKVFGDLGVVHGMAARSTDPPNGYGVESIIASL
jgi:hypothetical protein